ncbi:MAG: 2-oxo acid dehydrogenase subunit E2 [Actinobacteria bacterium]|jgi:pyruvate dehydrogenase E2 component (dihydrolipoamide acetyltransferase)|nr:2-oxo acid dehydrogenase subunit E2 [Actinomycetota bacterium]
MPDVKDFKLPDLGEGLEEGEVVEWHVAVGDVIELNQTVASIETAKAVVDVPSPFAGKVVERIGDIGEALEVGSVFLRIDIDVEGGAVVEDEAATPADTEASPAQGGFEAGAAAAEKSVEETAGRKSTGLDADEEPQPLVGYGQGKSGARRRRRGGTAAAAAGNGQAAASVRPLAKPPVRKLAKDLGVDLAEIAPGSGPDGVITRDDVNAAANEGSAAPREQREPAQTPAAVSRAQAPAAAGGGASAARTGDLEIGFRGRTPGEVEQIRGIRKRIVEKMETSRRDIPAASCTREADLTELWEVRKQLTQAARDEGHDVKITPFALVMRAAVLGLRRFPTLNARIDRSPQGDSGSSAGEIRLLEHINLGFAADTERGLVVPNIKDAHAKSTLQLALELSELADKARTGKLTPTELTGGTFTVNNYGAFGNDDGDPIINHPEAGILGIGAIRERPWVVQGELQVRRVATFRLAFDHRVCDGGEAGRFVTYVAELCEQPSRILLHS